MLLIVIHGARQKKLPELFKPIVDRYYGYFGVEDESAGRLWLPDFVNYFRNQAHLKVLTYNWSGNLTRVAASRAGKKLAEIIDRLPEQEKITIFGKSLGGNVADFAVRYASHKNKIKKIIYVAAPHQPKTPQPPDAIRAINIYSPADNYLDFANRLLYLGLGMKHLSYAENIIIPDIRHSQFSKNIPVTVNNKKIRLYEFYQTQF